MDDLTPFQDKKQNASLNGNYKLIVRGGNNYIHPTAIIGDDVNDLEIIKTVGFAACPSDAMDIVKTNVDVILSKKGGEGCVREFIDSYLLKQPLEN